MSWFKKKPKAVKPVDPDLLPCAYKNMLAILENLDIEAEYRLILEKKSCQPRRVRDAVVEVVRMAEAEASK